MVCRYMLTASAFVLTMTVTYFGNGPAKGQPVTNVPPSAQVTHVTANEYDWTLDKSTFRHGSPIYFHLSCSSGVHGFSIVGTKISVPLASGQQKTIVWTPLKAGRYTIMCDKFCGPGHDSMKATFTVS